MVTPWRPIKGAEPDAIKVASPVLNGGDEETGLLRPRLVATQLRQRLTASVDMTSDVKGWEQLFYVWILIFPFCLAEEAEPVRHDG